jgi:hypothetical protein
MSSNIPNGWSSYVPYAIPPLAASAAIVPVFYGFEAKSALQLGNSYPRMTPHYALRSGLKASPTIGAIVGTQMIVQKGIEEKLSQDGNRGFYTMLASSMLVGTVSAPLLAIFNGQTMGRSPMDSLQGLSLKQSGAIIARETSFLFSVRVSEPVSKSMKEMGGDHPLIEHGAAFLTGMIGSVCGHPADTALTLWQNGRNMAVSQSMRGAIPKALACGGFTAIYRWINQTMIVSED